MTRYASGTDVSSDRSRNEIERTLQRYGAESFMYGTTRTRAVVGFQVEGRQVRFELPMPDRQDRAFTHTEGRGQKRSDTQAHAAWEQACRQRWRALALVIKAKLEAIESGITDFDSEFMAHLVLPTGQTVGQAMLPRLEEARRTNAMPELLPMLEPPR
ncbi:hypothetical protein [Coralloluteibacterium thermophilus]|uniref:DUF4304 domain-containing protein n=1 Tax=Coralloluteibacterium thermophilum TaxID=2707049 RepID=A0ABV9NFF1_9GAMM